MIIQAVLELGGQLESKDRSGATPLFLACEMGKLVCACALMTAGADLQTRNSAGEAPLYIAALKGHERIVEELLKEFRERSLRWTVKIQPLLGPCFPLNSLPGSKASKIAHTRF